MAKKKAELEQDAAVYEAHLARAEESLRHRNFDDALAHAVAAWDYVEGMILYKRRYSEQQFRSIRCVDIVTTYAPMLFRSDVLEQLGVLLKAQRRVEKNTTADLGHALATARRRLIDAHRLWNLVSQAAGARFSDLAINLGGDQAEWESLAALWLELGVLRRTSDPVSSAMLALATNVEEACRAKCPCCGSVVRAPKRKLLETQKCPKCAKESCFCLLS